MDTLQMERSEEELKKKMPIFVYTLTLMAAIGGFLFGYDTGVISGAMLLLKPAFSLSQEWQELIVSITVGAAALFALIGGYLTDIFGRKPVILLASAIFALGSILLGSAQNRTMLILGRFVVGAGIGIASMTVPMYIAEASPPALRGRLVTMNNLFITFGQFAAGVLNGAFSYAGQDGWRYMLGVAAVPAMVQFIGFLFVPESPRWLIEHGRYERAKQVLSRIRGNAGLAESEFHSIRQAFDDTEKERMDKGGKFLLITVLTTPHVRRALIVGCCLQMFQQLVGINTVMYYSGTIIRMAGIKQIQMAIWLAAAVAGVNFLFTFVGLYLVERIGRRPLTLGSLFFVMLSLLLLGVAFNLMSSHSPPIVMHESLSRQSECFEKTSCDSCIQSTKCGYCFLENSAKFNFNGSCLPVADDADDHATTGRCNDTQHIKDPLTWAFDWCPTDYAWLAILGLVLYLMAFAPGMGPMPWTINSEIYPQWARSTGNALATATNWLSNLLVSMTFLSLMTAVTKQGAYYIYSGVALVGLIFLFLFLPETRGKALEEVDGLFARPWFNGKSLSEPPSSGFQYVHIRGHNRQFYRDDDDDELAFRPQQ